MLYNYLLEAFIQTAETGSFSKAAKNCFLTQPALTLRINALEKSMNVELFTRTQRGVKLTKAGEVLLEKIPQLVELSNQIESECQRAHSFVSSSIRIALSRDDQLNIYEEIHHEFSKFHPEVLIKLVQVDSNKTDQALIDNLVDIAIQSKCSTDETIDSLSFKYITDLFQCVLVSRSHRLAKREFLLLSDLRKETLYIPNNTHFEDVIQLANYIEKNEPEINIKPKLYDVTTRYECELEQALMLSPQIFSKTCSPLVAISLHCSFKAFFGLTTRKNTTKIIEDYIEAAQIVAKKWHQDCD